MESHYPTHLPASDERDGLSGEVGSGRPVSGQRAPGVDSSGAAGEWPALSDALASRTQTDGEQARHVPSGPPGPPGPPGSRAPAPADAPLPRVFLTAREVGQQLGIRKSRVYELAAAGLLPVVRLGRRMLFPCHGLEALATAAIERARSEVLGAGTSYPTARRPAPLPLPRASGSDSHGSGRPTGRRAA